jgi:phosphonate C-P lyase system protein PhnG
MGKKDVEQFLDLLDDFSIEVVNAPESGLIMAHARDCFNVDFYLGEILVTTTEVECSGVRGHATIMGDEPLKAVLAAAVSAIVQGPQAEAFTELNPLIEACEQKYEHLRLQENQLTAATKVKFESMAKET